MAEAANNSTMAADVQPPQPQEMLVVGIGASAGGIAALKRFFGAVERDSGMAYVVILHLSPDHESSLAEVIQAGLGIPVTQVRERTRLRADHVYVVPPNKKFSLQQGEIVVSDFAGIEERRAPVDMFFRTLADSEQARAVCVVLSGSGADGSMGLKRVKEYGGLCLVQDPADAEFGDMPRSAIATGYADYVLPAARMPARLAAYRRHVAAEPAGTQGADEQDQALVDIFTQLRLRTGHDFTNYKRSTVVRRVHRRMNVHEMESVAAYAAFVRDNRDEARALLKDLLISVTNFFRDPPAWEALGRRVIPMLFHGKRAHDHVRVWVAGCATGEEAYSIAMLLAEHAPEPLACPTIQVFATDIDEGALAKARAGLYTLNDAADVSPDRLRRFFLKDGDAYRVRRELRETVLFAAHNVIKDPPFSHLDLVTCRNLLIYLNRAAQERILKLFHFGLDTGGYLFLGTSESAEDIANLFVAVDKEAHVYQSRPVETPLAMPPVSATPLPIPPAARDEPLAEARLRERISYQELHQRLLEQYAPPSLVVNQDFDILHMSERVGRYLQFVGGEPSQNLLKVVRPELRLELHSALYHAVQNRTIAEAVTGPVVIENAAERVRLLVSPVFGQNDTSRGMILVLFEPAGREAAPHAQMGEMGPSAEPIARQLEDELVRVKLQLRTTIEQHEIQQEELKASNEELQAMNEELRSSSEELETSKEELQSLNEELTTVNQELKIKIDELSQANNDTRNLMNSTDIATVFVDRGMRIKLFTPRARSLFNLIPADTGRPLLDITHRLRYPELVSDIENVLDTLTTVEREVESVNGDWYIARVLPYRTADDRIAGVVLTFTDITERKHAEDARRESEDRVRLLVESVTEYAIFTLDTEGRITTWNSGASDLFGYAEAEAIGQPVDIIFSPRDREAGAAQDEMREARDSGRASDERWHVRKDGSRIFVSGVMAPMRRGGKLVGYSKVARDLTHRQRSEEELRAAREELEHRVNERTGELAAANEALRRQIEDRSHSEEARLHLLRMLVSAQEQERARLSRELHDQLGQDVTALGLKLSAVRSMPGLPGEARTELVRLEDVVRKLDGDVEFLVWELRPTGLDDLGLASALSDYVAGWSSYFGLHARLHTSLEGRLPGEVEIVLYRIAQEALNNVVKHAKARNVELDLRREPDSVLLTIADDGLGFDAENPGHAKSLGLVGMRERAGLVGGTAEIRSKPGGGTTVLVRVPA